MQVDCEGVAPQKCLLIKTEPNGDWEYFYDEISGFTFEERFTYELTVNIIAVPNPPADGSSIRYQLVEVVQKQAVASAATLYISQIEVMIMESFPVQVSAIIRGDFSDGCSRLDSISAERQGSTFNITVVGYREEDACTLALVPFEENVSLDVDGLPAGTYQIVADDVTTEFTLAMDNSAETTELISVN